MRASPRLRTKGLLWEGEKEPVRLRVSVFWSQEFGMNCKHLIHWIEALGSYTWAPVFGCICKECSALSVVNQSPILIFAIFVSPAAVFSTYGTYLNFYYCLLKLFDFICHFKNYMYTLHAYKKTWTGLHNKLRFISAVVPISLGCWHTQSVQNY
jgi:hypothetical protein